MLSTECDLPGKVAIVNGGSRGLGKSMAIGLATAGAHIVVCDVLEIKGNGRCYPGLGARKYRFESGCHQTY